MFNTQQIDSQENTMNTEHTKKSDHARDSREPARMKKANTIVKGSKLTGDITISYDLELYGDVDGNITSEQKSDIVIKGNCKGNIHTREGNIDIEGQKSKGDIVAGGDIKITGRFSGGKAEAKGKIFVDGEFNGKLEGNEIEIGPRAKGKGELIYKENISIARGSRVEVNISHTQPDQKTAPKTDDAKVVNIERPVQDKKVVNGSTKNLPG